MWEGILGGKYGKYFCRMLHDIVLSLLLSRYMHALIPFNSFVLYYFLQERRQYYGTKICLSLLFSFLLLKANCFECVATLYVTFWDLGIFFLFAKTGKHFTWFCQEFACAMKRTPINGSTGKRMSGSEPQKIAYEFRYRPTSISKGHLSKGRGSMAPRNYIGDARVYLHSEQLLLDWNVNQMACWTRSCYHMSLALKQTFGEHFWHLLNWKYQTIAWKLIGFEVMQ